MGGTSIAESLPSCARNLKTLSLNPLQASVRILKAEPCRIPRAADPFLHFLVLLVFRVSQRRQQVVVAGDAAAVLWRAGVGPSHTDGMFEGRVQWQCLFHYRRSRTRK